MRTTTVACDRCHVQIDTRVTTLDLMGGVVPRLRDRVDLCESCATAFNEFLAARPVDRGVRLASAWPPADAGVSGG